MSSSLPFIAVVAAVVLTKATARLRPPARNLTVVAILSGLFVLNFNATRPALRNWFTLGYPSFLDAMAFLRVHARPGATVLGANFPQIHWYSDLHAINIPEEHDLPEALRHSPSG